MTIGHHEQPSLDDAERYLAAVVGKLTAYGIQVRLSSDGRVPNLLATNCRSGRARGDGTVDSGIWIQAAWTRAHGSDPATTADAILALNAISPQATSIATEPVAR